MATLTPLEIWQLAYTEAKKHPDPRNSAAIRSTFATAVAIRESGGDTAAYRDASKNKNGGNDRGLYQINSKWHPEVSDATAYDPVLATAAAYTISIDKETGVGFKNWEAWDGAKLGVAELRLAQDAARDAGHNVFIGALSSPPDDGFFDSVTDAAVDIYEAGSDVVDAVTAPYDLIRKFLSFITSADWWKRIGLGALGVVLVGVAIVLLFAKDATESVTPT